MRNLLVPFVFLCSMLAAAEGLATDLGPPAAGFDGGGFTMRLTLKGSTTQYLLTDASDPNAEYRASFATGGAEAAFGFQDRVRLLATFGVGGFNGYNQAFTAPDGTYKVYGGGVRVTAFRPQALDVELGGGANLTWWEEDGQVAAGEWTLLGGLAARPLPGFVLYGGLQYFSVGGTQAVPATVNTTPVRLQGEGYAGYGGAEFRLGILSARLEARAEVPTLQRTGFGLSAGFEF